LRAAAISICRPAAPACRSGSQLSVVAKLPPAIARRNGRIESRLLVRTSFQSTSSSSAMIIAASS